MVDFIRGDTQPLRVKITHEDKTPIRVWEIETLYITCRKKTTRLSPVLFQKNLEEVNIDEEGYCHFVIDSADTEQLSGGQYPFDIEVTLKNGYRKTGLYEFTIEKDTTIHSDSINNLALEDVTEVELEEIAVENSEVALEEVEVETIVEYYDDTELREAIEELNENKVDKVAGKGLSTNDYTTEEKEKLAGLNNYDDTEVKQDITDIKNEQTTQNTNISNLNENKANKSETYTKTQVNNLLEEKVSKEVGKSLISDTEIARLAGVINYDDTEVKQDISNIKAEQTTQNTNIQNNTEDIESLENAVSLLNEGQIVQNEAIEALGEDNASQDEYIADLEEQIDQMKSQFDTGTAEGESIVLEDSSDMRFKDFTLGGNKKQQTYKGNQLVDFSKMTAYNSTYTFEDNVLIINGTGPYARAYKNITTLVKENPGKKLFYDFESVDTSEIGEGTFGHQITVQHLDDEGVSHNSYYSRTKGAYTIPEDTSKITSVTVNFFQHNGSGSKPGTVKITKPIIFWGEETPEYEPYVGGQVSPNAEYPQAIYAVGDSGSANVKIINSNLFNIDGRRVYSTYRSTLTVDGTKITAVANDRRFSTVCSTGIIVPLPSVNRDIRISMESLTRTGSNTNAKLRYGFVDEIPSNISLSFGRNIGVSDIRKVITATPTGKYLIFVFCAQYVAVSVEERTITVDSLSVSYSEDETYREHEEQDYIIPVQEPMVSEEDYFDWDNEKEIHNWNKIDSYNGETITTEYISTTGGLDTGATVYYKLTEPRELEFTEAQKNVAKQIAKAHTYKNVTHIYSTDETSPNFEIEYYKDNETLRENDKKELQDQIDELRQAVVALGGVE